MEQTEQKKRRQGWFEWAQIICGVLIFITCLYIFVCRTVDVHGSSMETTLVNGERLLLSSLPYKPQYEDIVVISRGNEDEPLIKRIIGLPGDTIRIDAQTGAVYRNDELLQEPYIHAPTDPEQMTGPVTVPPEMVFVMGDNRAKSHSLDSRTFGCVSQENVIGKVVFRLFPLDRMGGLYDDKR